MDANKTLVISLQRLFWNTIPRVCRSKRTARIIKQVLNFMNMAQSLDLHTCRFCIPRESKMSTTPGFDLEFGSTLDGVSKLGFPPKAVFKPVSFMKVQTIVPKSCWCGFHFPLCKLEF